MGTVEKYFSILQKATDRYEENHPHWRQEVILSVINWGLQNLQHFVEAGQEKRITWQNPFVGLRYSIQWNWQRQGVGDVIAGGHLFGKLTKQNTATPELAGKTIGKSWRGSSPPWRWRMSPTASGMKCGRTITHRCCPPSWSRN